SDFKDALVTTLAGPKGAFTLALMMTLPLSITTANGVTPFPQRSLLLFLASGVIILTLLLATFVVPALAPKEVAVEPVTDENEITVEIFRKVIELLTEQQTPQTRFATTAVIRSYNARISRLKNSTPVEDASSHQQLRVQALTWEEEFVQDLIEKEEIDSVLGYSYLNRLTQAQNLITHHSGNQFLVTRMAARHPIRVIKSFAHLVKHKVTHTDSSDRKEVRKIQRRAGEHVISKLHDEMSNPQTPSEEISKLLLEYQRRQRRFRSARSEVSVTSITKAAAQTTDVGHLGLNLELDLIQTMLENDRISAATAKRLRENVNLMRLDLDQSI
ncbi:MAG: hypothetical protein FWG47_07340, partial [Propionibacteriaceae bacterium]|nr:hypothetical protein [Propionibacteriaceae bacterium]